MGNEFKKNDFTINFGRQIANLRTAKNLSQDALAEICNISPHAISLIETGKRFPRIDTLQKLSNAFGITIYDLFDFTKNSPDIDNMYVAVIKMTESIKTDKIRVIALYNFLKNLIIK